MSVLTGSNHLPIEAGDHAGSGPPSSTLPSAIRSRAPAGRSTDALTPKAAISIWDAVMASEGSAFLAGYQRDAGRTGAFDEGEKVRMVREAFEMATTDSDGDPARTSRAQVVRETARRLGLLPPQSNDNGRTYRNLPPGSLGTMMMLGLALVDTLEDGRITEEALDTQPALWFHGTRSPLTGDPAADRAFIRGALAWARCGFPRVILVSHRLAANMMWIDATRGMESVRPPWDAFWISVPNNLVRYDGGRGTTDITDGFVHVRPSGAVVARFGDSTSLGLQVLRPNLAALGKTEGIAPDWAKHHPDSALLSGLVDCAEPAHDTVAAATEMLSNLVLSVCVDMTAHRPAPRVRRSGASSGTAIAEPASTDYVIERRTVHVHDPDGEDVNCIAAVREYGRDPSQSRSATTQRIHRAHYQMQTYGPRSSLRRLQLHRAYRQGPTDAPIAVRPHVRGSRSE